MTKKIFALSLTGAALIGATAVYAQSAEQRGPQGDVTRAEAQQRAEQMFDRMDANSDGTIDAADREARERARFDEMDADSNGAISFAEFQAKNEQRKDRWSERRAERGERRGGPGMRGMRGHGKGMHGMGEFGENASITKAQFAAKARERFDAADTDKNGTLTAAERQAQHAERREMRQQRGPAPSAEPST